MDLIAKYQNYLLGLAIFLSLLAVSFTYRDGVFNMTLASYPVLMLLLVAISIVLVVAYIQIDKNRINNLTQQISANSKLKTDTTDDLLSSLTSRQREVYNLIVSGKSNKQIMSDLYIEQSTLKSHINQIYKKLNIKNRKELKSRVNP